MKSSIISFSELKNAIKNLGKINYRSDPFLSFFACFVMESSSISFSEPKYAIKM